jgi:hypothetical protein
MPQRCDQRSQQAGSDVEGNSGDGAGALTIEEPLRKETTGRQI